MRRPLLLGILAAALLVLAIFGDPAGCFDSKSLKDSAIFEEIGNRNSSDAGRGRSSSDEPFKISPFGD